MAFPIPRSVLKSVSKNEKRLISRAGFANCRQKFGDVIRTDLAERPKAAPLDLFWIFTSFCRKDNIPNYTKLGLARQKPPKNQEVQF